MAVYTLNNDQALRDQYNSDDGFKVNDILVTKQWEFYDIYARMKAMYPDINMLPISPGTVPFTRYGYGSSVITGGIAGREHEEEYSNDFA